MTMEFKEPDGAFDRAIADGVLSNDRGAANFAGVYMYMYSDEQGDHFKHIRTRQYVTNVPAGVGNDGR